MLTVGKLVELQQRFPGLIDAPFVIDGVPYDTDATPVVMGVVNLSRDSTYRESIALTFESSRGDAARGGPSWRRTADRTEAALRLGAVRSATRNNGSPMRDGPLVASDLPP